MDVCPTGKIVHPDRRHALDHLASMKRAGMRDGSQTEAYRCNQCDGWHVGRRIGTRKFKGAK